MTAWRPLFRILVGHDFFRGDPCPVAEVAPDRRSSEVARRAGLVIRRSPGSVAVLHAGEAGAVAHLAEPGEALRLDFRVEARDPRFHEYTEPGAAPSRQVVAVDNRGASRGSGPGPVRLSREERVSEADLAEMDSEEVFPLLTPRDRRFPPAAFASIHVVDADGSPVLHDAGPGGVVYRLDFRARATYWRYHLLGGLARERASVTDQDRATEFTHGGEVLLPGDRRALTFRSTTPIPLRERSERRFQLRLEGTASGGNGRVLVKRLPVASAEGIRRETIDGSPAFVSDIFVNG